MFFRLVSLLFHGMGRGNASSLPAPSRFGLWGAIHYLKGTPSKQALDAGSRLQPASARNGPLRTRRRKLRPSGGVGDAAAGSVPRTHERHRKGRPVCPRAGLRWRSVPRGSASVGLYRVHHQRALPHVALQTRRTPSHLYLPKPRHQGRDSYSFPKNHNSFLPFQAAFWLATPGSFSRVL